MWTFASSLPWTCGFVDCVDLHSLPLSIVNLPFFCPFYLLALFPLLWPFDLCGLFVDLCLWPVNLPLAPSYLWTPAPSTVDQWTSGYSWTFASSPALLAPSVCLFDMWSRADLSFFFYLWTFLFWFHTPWPLLGKTPECQSYHLCETFFLATLLLQGHVITEFTIAVATHSTTYFCLPRLIGKEMMCLQHLLVFNCVLHIFSRIKVLKEHQKFNRRPWGSNPRPQG